MADLFLGEAALLSGAGHVGGEDIEGGHSRDGLVKLA
jgi:hypothetical protein